MASTDALPVPRKNVAFRVIFPILDADGDLVTGASALDSEVSKDQAAFADCTNEATEIATNSGMYYLDLTSTEMNADCVAVIVKTSTSGAKTTPLVMYPQETGDIKVDVTSYGGSAGTFASGRPEVNATQFAGQTITAGAGVTMPATVASTTNITAGTITTVTNLTNAPTAGDLTATMKTSVTTAATAATPTVTAGTVSDKTGYALTAAYDAAKTAATQASVDIIDDFLDTEIAAILAAVDTEVAAIKAKTDGLTYTVANVVDVNLQRVNDVALLGDGSATPWGPV